MEDKSVCTEFGKFLSFPPYDKYKTTLLELNLYSVVFVRALNGILMSSSSKGEEK